MKTYTYHIFLRDPVTKDCKIMTVSTDAADYLPATELFRRLSLHADIPSTHTLVGLNVGLVTVDEGDND